MNEPPLFGILLQGKQNEQPSPSALLGTKENTARCGFAYVLWVLRLLLCRERRLERLSVGLAYVLWTVRDSAFRKRLSYVERLYFALHPLGWRKGGVPSTGVVILMPAHIFSSLRYYYRRIGVVMKAPLPQSTPAPLVCIVRRMQ